MPGTLRHWRGPDVGWDPSPYAMNALGGTITDVDGYRVHIFTTSGPFTVLRAGAVEYLLVAGGASGSSGTAGGGGAGGVLTNLGGIPLELDTGTYDIVIGAGGAAPAGTQRAGNDGQDSTAFGLLTRGGGTGGFTASDGRSGNAHDGGSGGGGSIYDSFNKTPGAGTTGQGRAGAVSPGSGGGGGGGAGGPGNGRAGGPGVASTITGALQYYAGGGGGSGSGDAGPGGIGGGGGGSQDVAIGGTPNTGSGGGGGWTYANGVGGEGGSGLLVVRYLR